MKANAQRGLSLIELMIAMVIGLILMLGVAQLFIDNKKSYTFQQNQSENQESTRYSLLFLQQTLIKAGYRRRPDQTLEYAFPAAVVSGCTFAAGETIVRDGNSSVCIRYQPRDHQERDCLGNIIDNTLTNPYTKTSNIAAERISFNAANKEITCTRGSTTASIVNGVADLRFEYGVGSAVEPRKVSSFIKTNPSSSTQQPILAVRFTTLFKSTGTKLRENVNNDVDTVLANWSSLSGAGSSEISAMKTADDRHIYQAAQNTVMLRNRMP